MTIPAAPYPDAVTLEAVCTVATGAYASGQFMGLIGSGVGQASNPLTFSLPWPPGTEFLIQSVQLIDLSKQSAAIDVVFFNAFPGSTTFTDSATFAPAAVDLSKIITVANITSYDSFSANSVGKVNNLAKPSISQGQYAAGQDSKIYAALVSRGTPTYSTATDVRLIIDVLRWSGT